MMKIGDGIGGGAIENNEDWHAAKRSLRSCDCGVGYLTEPRGAPSVSCFARPLI